MMRRLLFAALSLFFLIFNVACSNSGSEEKTNPIDGTYYCEKLTLVDENGNYPDLYFSNIYGSENTYLTISKGEKVEFCWYYHGEADDVLVGSIKEVNGKEGQYSGYINFDGSNDKYEFSYTVKEDTGEIKSFVLILPKREDGSILGLCLSDEKLESSSGQYEDIVLFDDIFSYFESSETYKNLVESIKEAYDPSDWTLQYDSKKKELILSLDMESLAGTLGQLAELEKPWDELCESFDENSKSIQTSIDTQGYKGICFVHYVKDGETMLYISRNGERVYNYLNAGKRSENN